MNVKNKKLKKLKAAFDYEALTNLYNKNFTFTRKGGKLYSMGKDEKHIFQSTEGEQSFYKKSQIVTLQTHMPRHSSKGISYEMAQL